MSKFRKGPVVVEARQFTGTPKECHAVYEWVARGIGLYNPHCDAQSGAAIAPDGALLIATLKEVMKANYRDWVIRVAPGVFIPCEPDIFAAAYEPVDEEAGVMSVRHELHFTIEDGEPRVKIVCVDQDPQALCRVQWDCGCDRGTIEVVNGVPRGDPMSATGPMGHPRTAAQRSVSCSTGSDCGTSPWTDSTRSPSPAYAAPIQPPWPRRTASSTRTTMPFTTSTRQ